MSYIATSVSSQAKTKDCVEQVLDSDCCSSKMCE